MNLLLKFALAFLSVAYFVCGEIELDGDVLVLDDSNFEEAKTTYDKLLVEFYAPWCGHCKTLAPEWAKAATALKEAPLKLAKVDATVATELAKTYGISGFPTIKYFKNGTPSDYDGGRTEKEIVSWVNKKSGPPATTVTTVAELEKLEAANDAIVVGLFKSLDSDLAKSFVAFAGATSLDTPFVISSSAEVLAKVGVTKDAIVVLKVFDEKRDDFALGATLDDEALTTFLSAKTTPLIQDYSPSTSKKIFGSDIKKHALYFVNKAAADYSASATYELLTEAAKTHKGEVLFITVGSDNTGILGYFDLKEADLPKFIIIDMSVAIKKFPLNIDSADLDAKAISAHAAAFVAGTLTPTLKTEEPTPEDVAKPVKVVKGKSFNDLVINTKKDVLLEIYAPWCGHCKKLEPIYDEVAEELKDDETVVLAKMDGTANEVADEDFATSGFPSLFWVPGDTKKVVKYEGGREKADILAYIKKHATKTYVAGHEEL